jgi:pSer/pThr/pTyr-binding forkhead associated (FHA) protein
MLDKKPLPQKKISADWLVHGLLTKIGDTVDRLTGRGWRPSSSLAASELIDRLKKLLDLEAKSVPGKGLVVPHNIRIRMQWDKFSEDAEAGLRKLQFELLTAIVDHINDSLYYTFAPVSLDVKPDYFVEGVKIYAGFDEFAEEDDEVALNVTIPTIDVSHLVPQKPAGPAIRDTYIAKFSLKDVPKEVRLEFPAGSSVSVGRTGTNALMIDDGSVSKMHASLSVDADGGLRVADTGSTNGTFVNDERIAYGKSTPVATGDRVRFGLIETEFEYVSPPVVIEIPEEPEGTEPTGETVEIGGFQFKAGASPDPEEQAVTESAIVTISDQASQSPTVLTSDEHATTPKVSEEAVAAIPIPSQTLKVSPNRIEETQKVMPAAAVPKPAVGEDDRADDEPETVINKKI